jgi:hypothetical protein
VNGPASWASGHDSLREWTGQISNSNLPPLRARIPPSTPQRRAQRHALGAGTVRSSQGALARALTKSRSVFHTPYNIDTVSKIVIHRCGVAINEQ